MPLYTYKAKDLDGRDYEGVLEAESEDALISSLHKQGKIILSIAPERRIPKKGDLIGKAISVSIFQPKVKNADIVLFATQLSTLVEAGLPLLKALNTLALETENPALRHIISNVSLNVEEGMSLSEALSRHPVFSNLFIGMVRAGEISGRLNKTLKDLATYLENMENIKRKIRSAITYPSFLVVFSMIVLSILILKVVPAFQNVYAKFKAKLPLPTQILIQVSNAFRDNFFFIISGLAVIVLLIYILLRTEQGKLLRDRIVIKIPIFGIIIQKAILSRFSRTLGILVGSGIPFLDAMRLVAITSNNKVIERAIDRSTIDIEGGSTIADALEKTGEFPRMLISMIGSGEEVGALEGMLQKAADFYDQQVGASVTGLTAILEPILIVFLGGIIGMILLAMYLPVFTLGKAIAAGGG
jgi:type IV pilus assembly protein PilC